MAHYTAHYTVQSVIEGWRNPIRPSVIQHFSTAGLTRVDEQGSARPKLDRSFNSLSGAACVRVSGFNSCLEDSTNAHM
jgi:hypothetical protein